MSSQRVHQFRSQSPQFSASTSQFAPRQFPVQEPKRPSTQEDIENEAFQQNKFEVFGLQLKEKQGTITTVEQEKLGMLQAKMDSFWVQRMERAKAQPNLLEILIRNAQSTQATEPTTPVQPKLTIEQPNDPYEQETEQVADQVMNMSPPVAPSVQRQTEEEQEELQAQPLVGTITPVIQRQELSDQENQLQTKCEACEQNEQIQRAHPYLARQQADGTATPIEPADAQSTPSGGATSGQSSCNPTPLSRSAFLAQAGTSFSELGLTTLSVSAVTFPEVHISGGRGPVQPTNAALPPIPSIYVGAGSFSDPGDRVQIYAQEGSYCRTGLYPRRWIITQAGADRIRAGEQEHCQDFQYAFDISLARYRDAVNQLAARGQRFPNENAAKQHLFRQVGVHPDNWQGVFICLAGKTQIRDSRRQDWHTPRPGHSALDSRCEYANVTVGPQSLPQVGQHSTPSIIAGCGETPVRTPRPGAR